MKGPLKFVIEFRGTDKSVRTYDASTPKDCFAACLYEFSEKYNSGELADDPNQETIKKIVELLDESNNKKVDTFQAGKQAYLFIKNCDKFSYSIHEPNS